MVEVSVEQVHELARLGGIVLRIVRTVDGVVQRAEAVAARLRTVLTELSAIPDDTLADLEPASTFVVRPEVRNG